MVEAPADMVDWLLIHSAASRLARSVLAYLDRHDGRLTPQQFHCVERMMERDAKRYRRLLRLSKDEVIALTRHRQEEDSQ
jgi:hypothetical protein